VASILIVILILYRHKLFSCIISACTFYYCNTVRWAWLHWGLSGWLTALLQCFDTVGWVIRPVKTVGRITYIVLVQNHAQSISQPTQVNVLCLDPSRASWYSINNLPRRNGRLSLPRWLATYGHGLPTHRWSPIQLLTWPDVEHLCLSRPMRYR